MEYKKIFYTIDIISMIFLNFLLHNKNENNILIYTKIHETELSRINEHINIL